jgi:hypothetical protein
MPSPSALFASALFLALTAIMLVVARQVALMVIADQWARGNYVPFTLGLRAVRTKASEPLLGSLGARFLSDAAGARAVRGMLALTPERLLFQSDAVSIELPLRNVRHLTVDRDGRLVVQVHQGAGLGGTLGVPNPPAVARLIQAATQYRAPR